MASTTAALVVQAVWILATIVPFVAVGVRRLHDTNKSGWWILLPGIPYAISTVWGWIWSFHAYDAINEYTQYSMYAHTSQELADMSRTLMRAMAPAGFMSILGLIYLISGIVLMVGNSNPAGVRFDDDIAQTQNPYTGTQNPYANQNPYVQNPYAGQTYEGAQTPYAGAQPPYEMPTQQSAQQSAQQTTPQSTPQNDTSGTAQGSPQA